MNRSGLIYGLLLSLVILAGGTWIFSNWLFSRNDVTSETVPATIGQLRLAVPAAFVRARSSAIATNDRIDVVMAYPGMMPLEHGKPEKGAAERDQRLLIFATIERIDGVIDPAQRITDLYGRFLEATTFDHPGGLVLRRFEAGSPYSGEELYIAPPDGSTFHARCPTTQSGKSGVDCLWRQRRNQADITIRFARELLPHWEELAGGVNTRLKEWSRGGK